MRSLPASLTPNASSCTANGMRASVLSHLSSLQQTSSLSARRFSREATLVAVWLAYSRSSQGAWTTCERSISSTWRLYIARCRRNSEFLSVQAVLLHARLYLTCFVCELHRCVLSSWCCLLMRHRLSLCRRCFTSTLQKINDVVEEVREVVMV